MNFTETCMQSHIFYMCIYIHEIDTRLLKITLLMRRKITLHYKNDNDHIILTNQITSKNCTIWCRVWVVNNNINFSINNLNITPPSLRLVKFMKTKYT